MELNEIKQKRDILQTAIARLVGEFEQETQTHVHNITMYTKERGDDQGRWRTDRKVVVEVML